MLINHAPHFDVRLSLQNGHMYPTHPTQRMTLKVPIEYLLHMYWLTLIFFPLAVYIPISGTPGMFKVPAPPQPSNPLNKSSMRPDEVFRISVQPQLTTPSYMSSAQREASGRNSPDAEDDLSQGLLPVSAIIVY